MNQSVLNFLKKYSHNTWDVNRLLVSSFLISNSITNVNNSFIKSYIINNNTKEEFEYLNQFIVLLKKHNFVFGIEELIELFEFVISPAEKEVNGAVFTPEYIRSYIVKESISKFLNSSINPRQTLSDIIFGDIACGCGGFFKTIAETIKKTINKSYYDIFKENIYGLDIQDYSIERTKILLCLFAISNDEDAEEFEFNLYQGNALSFKWDSIASINLNKGFDIIVGNPPYVGASKMDIETKVLLKTWSVSKLGKSDLYIPFFEIGMENLNHLGVLGLITVNTFYKSLNGKGVRKYFSKNKFDLTIVDFGGEQLFKSRSTYTCICIISKYASNCIKYVKTASNNITQITSKDYVVTKYESLDDNKGWHLINNHHKTNISKIENTGTPLGEKFLIRNGFATLKNNVYVFKPLKESKSFFYLEKDGEEFQIEKEICRNAIKPNTLKSENEIEKHTEKLIFPYEIKIKKTTLFESTDEKEIQIINEESLKEKYPFTYKYLVSQKSILANRDKGEREYEEWYAFGRNQALTLYGYKLLFPYISERPCFVFTDNQDLLFYNGYAIFSDSIEELQILQKILMSSIFWLYIKKTSKPYAGNYFSLAKNYIKNFGICHLSKEDKKKLLKIKSPQKIDEFLFDKYGIFSNKTEEISI